MSVHDREGLLDEARSRDPQARRKCYEEMRKRYAEAKSNNEKGILLDEFTLRTGCHRKHANRVLRRVPLERKARASRSKFTDEVVRVLLVIWRSAGMLCSKRLQEAIPLWLPAVQKARNVSEEAARVLLGMSPRSMDRLLKPYRARECPRRYQTVTTRIKRRIPIRSKLWDIAVEVGSCEVDMVSHGLAYSLVVTDIRSCWIEARAVPSKEPKRIVEALEGIRRALPFPLKELDSDNGGEFLNDYYMEWCVSHGIKPTRSRPGAKNDNAHIEQKNGTHIRSVFGEQRIDGRQEVDRMNRLYRDDLSILWNYFLPSCRLIQRGLRKARKHDRPQSPLDRLVSLGVLENGKVGELLAHRESINPVDLSRAISAEVEVILNVPQRTAKASPGQQLELWAGPA